MHFHWVDILFSITAVEAIASAAAFVVVLFRFRDRASFYAMVMFYGHMALYWNTIFIARLFFGYVGPSVWVSTISLWGAAVFLHASLAIIGDAIAKRANGVE